MSAHTVTRTAGRSPRLATLVALSLTALLVGCERPPVQSVQHGYRGTGMLNVYNPRTLAGEVAGNQPPAAQPAAGDEGPRARDVFKNVQVLGDLSVGALTRQMQAITTWVAPEQGCVHCHDLTNLADDGKYTKVVARRMLQMTQHINADWQAHVAATGVTCYTCHRGQPVPPQTWTQALPQDKRADFIGNLNGSNTPSAVVGLSSLPNDPFTPYLKQAAAIGVASKTALPTGHVASLQATEATYGLMFHMSQALGVNCTYCHNSRTFASWGESTPQRVVAWQGIRMVRELNASYIEGLASVLPAERKGALGDVPKAHCATCHQGAYKPLYGAPMAKDYPALLKTVAAVPPPAPAAASAAAPRKPVAKSGTSAALPTPPTGPGGPAVLAAASLARPLP